MPSKSKSSKKTRSGSRTNGTKKTITKSASRNATSRKKPHSKTRSRTPTHSKTRTPSHAHPSNTTRSQKYNSRSKTSSKTSNTSKTSKSKSKSLFTSLSLSGNHTRVGPSSSLGPGLNDPLLFVFLIILGLSVIVLLAVGIWLLASRNGWPHGLNQTGNIHYTRFISYGTACIISSILLIFIIIFILLAAVAKTGAAARITRLVAVFIASLVFIIFILMIITGIMFAAHKPAFVANLMRDGWSRTLLNGRTVSDTCDIQREYNCLGWLDNQCRNCRPTRDGVYDYTTPPGSSCTLSQRSFCPRCFDPVAVRRRLVVSALDLDTSVSGVLTDMTNHTLSVSTTVRTEVPGCRNFVRRRNRTFFIPFTVYISFLTIILLFLAWKTCIDSSGR